MQVTAKDVKKVLKENNINTKSISVRCKIVGYDFSINVTLKDLSLPKPLIEEILTKEFESYERDEFSGEILAGGNTYVFVEYDYKIKDEAIEKMTPKANEFVEELKKTDILWGYELATNNDLTLYANKETNILYINDSKNNRVAQWNSTDTYSIASALVTLTYGK